MNRDLAGPISFIHNSALNRRELRGLTSGATVRVQYTLAVDYEAAGLISITSSSANPSFSVLVAPSGAGSETVNLDGTHTVSSTAEEFINLSATATMNCTIGVRNFKITVTQPS